MQTRTKRYRARLKMAKATANSPECWGLWGQGSPVTRSDLLLLRRAIREDWPVPEHVREAVIHDVVAIATDDTSGPRMWVSAARVIIEMEAANMALD
jgi:hypothetical protein